MRIFVQGDRNAEGIEAAARELGEICKVRELELNLGSAGQLVRILTESGARCRVHVARDETPNTPKDFNGEIVDVRGLAIAMIGAIPRQERSGLFSSPRDLDRAAWALRLALLDRRSDAFLFFPGKQGTMAHLIPILAFIAKDEAEKGKTPRRVALVGWPLTEANLVRDLMDIERVSSPVWIAGFPLDKIEDAVTWLTPRKPRESDGRIHTTRFP